MKIKRRLQRFICAVTVVAMTFGLIGDIPFTGGADKVIAADAEWIDTNLVINGNFETSGGDNNWYDYGWKINSTADWSSSGISVKKNDSSKDNKNQTYVLNIWNNNSNTVYFEVTQTIDNLSAGQYKLTYDTEGYEGSDSGLTVSVANISKDIKTTGWNNTSTDEISFTIDSTQDVEIKLSGNAPQWYWCNVDNFILYKYNETVTDTTVYGAGINVDKISELNDDFYMGVDISSIVSEYESGVKFYDYAGNELSTIADFCKFLEECGVTHIRVRVWNNPYDDNGNGYGGGNCDINTAVAIAEACADTNLKLLIDFHYSDFWADPAKQKEPKAWEGYTLDQKADAVKAYTKDSLEKILAANQNVDMVQMGNETTGGFVGEYDVANMCTLFNAAADAINDVNTAKGTSIRKVIHVTNPESWRMTTWAKNLDDNKVDYDILATSYYPYWHGTLNNLKSEMSKVKTGYNKDVMVAETSLAYTLNDSDGHANTARVGNNDILTTAIQYDFSVQGQADFLHDLMETVNSVGGLGVFYWEPAWLTVGDTTGLTGDSYDARVEANKAVWEKYGSGWAASYAGEYDAEDAGEWYGGSAVDNEALFYSNGMPTESLRIWQYVRTGAKSDKTSVESIGKTELSNEIGTDERNTFTLPKTVSVVYSVAGADAKVSENVKWEPVDISSFNAGEYEIKGTVTFSKDITSGYYKGKNNAEVTYILTVSEGNIITDDKAAGFEEITNLTDVYDVEDNDHALDIYTYDYHPTDIMSGENTLHWYSITDTTATLTYKTPISLKAGWYTFELDTRGNSGTGTTNATSADKVTISVLNAAGNTVIGKTETDLEGYSNILSPQVTFYLAEDTNIKYQIQIDIAAEGWGFIDSIYLHMHENISTVTGTTSVDTVCDDCGMVLSSAKVPDVTTEAPSTEAPTTETPTTETPTTETPSTAAPEADVQAPQAGTEAPSTEAAAANDNAAKTGDDVNAGLLASIIALCGAAFVMAAVARKKADK